MVGSEPAGGGGKSSPSDERHCVFVGLVVEFGRGIGCWSRPELRVLVGVVLCGSEGYSYDAKNEA